MTAEIRRLGSSDGDALAEFFVQIRSDEAHFHPHPLTDAEAHRLAAYDGRDLYFVAVEDDSIVGYGMLRGWDEGYEVPSLGIALAPSRRGTGLACTFMDHLHDAARRRGARQVRLSVHDANVPARRMYDRLGYRFVDSRGGVSVGTLELEL